MARSIDSDTRPLATISLLLFCSGACALIFQIVWLRELRLIFGATTAASAAVVAVFMGGIGLGNALFAKRLDRARNPLAQYAKLEFGIAISAAMTPLLIGLTQSTYVALGGQSQLGGLLSTLVRLLATVIVLGIPTVLMGGTLPAAARVVTSEDDSRRRGVALVYATNTLGAVLGAALANFYLLEQLGSRGLLWTTCAANLLLASAAMAIARKLPAVAEAPAEKNTLEPAPSQSSKQRKAKRDNDDTPPGADTSAGTPLIYLAAGIVGFAFFLMEIVWYRMLGPLLGGSTYTFGLILCVALAGIGIGGGLYHLAASRVKPSLTLFSITCAFEAALIAAPFWAGDKIALYVLHQQEAVTATLLGRMFEWFQVASLLVLPAAIVAGFQFPVLVAVAGTGRRDVSKHVGWTLGANTLGAIAGSLLGGFVALPLLSAPVVWQGVVGLLMVLALAAALEQTRQPGARILSAGNVVTLAICLVAVFGIYQPGPTAVWRHSGIGASRAQFHGAGLNAEREFINARRRLTTWEAEGRESSVAITATDSLSFIVNGKSDGNAFDDAATQIGLGLVGPLLHKQAESALVIGLGTGESAGWLADVGTMQHVDVVELEPVVMEMARRCKDLNRNVLNNPKVAIQFNDAREALLTSHNSYDLIISEPSNPYRAGVASLYTREFYDAVASRLNADGLFLQWLQAYEIDSQTVRTVLRTLSASFPELQVWYTRSHDLLLVCGNSASALDYDEAGLRSRLADPVIQRGLQLAWRANDLEGVLAHYICAAPTVAAFVDAGTSYINTDDKNGLEYAFARTVGDAKFFRVRELEALASETGDDVPPGVSGHNADTLRRRRLAMHATLGGNLENDIPLDPQSERLAAILQHYMLQEYAEAGRLLQNYAPDGNCLVESLVACHVLAEIGQPCPEALLNALAERSPAEAASLRTLSAWRTASAPDAVDQLLISFELLSDDPWADKRLLKSILFEAANIAGAQGSADKIFAALEHPFAGYRVEDDRLLRRYVIAHALSTREVLAGLQGLEPHVPWQELVLRERAQLYRRQGSPLTEIAEAELSLFLQQQATDRARADESSAQR